MVTICLITSLTCQSQTTTEPVVPVPQSVLQKTVKLLEVGEFNKQKAALLQEQVNLLKEQIELKNKIIATYDLKDTSVAELIASHKAEVANLEQQVKTATVEATKQNKMMKRQKRKTVFVAIAGPVVTAAAFIYLKK